MKLGLGGQGAGQGKQSIVLIAVLVVVIGAAGFFVYRTFMGSSSPSPSMSDIAPPAPGAPMGAPTGWGDQPGAPAPGGQPAPPGAGAPPGGAPAPGGPGASAAPGGPGAPGAAPAPSGPAATAPAAAPAPAAAKPAAPASAPKPAASAKVEMRQLKVFGTVSVSYPSTWKITTGSGNASAVFTNGKAYFEVHAPDMKAATAKAIAESTMKKLAKGASIVAQGKDTIAGNETYWIAGKAGGQTIRVVGVDGPTRVALYEHVKGGQFAAYRDTFNQMQAEMKF